MTPEERKELREKLGVPWTVKEMRHHPDIFSVDKQNGDAFGFYSAEIAETIAAAVNTYLSDNQPLDEAAIRADERQKVLEEAARITESFHDTTYWDDPSSGIAAKLRRKKN